MNYEKLFRYDGKKGLLLNDWKTKFGSDFESKEKAVTEVKDDIAILASLQDKLYAQSRHAVLILFQAMDAAGKDSTIKHVMSGINPQGCLKLPRRRKWLTTIYGVSISVCRQEGVSVFLIALIMKMFW